MVIDHYSQLNVVRTVEQILGMLPMNQEDRTATPMFDAFTARPDFAPFQARPTQVPLTLGAPGFPARASSAAVNRLLAVSADERAVYRAWVAWSARQRFNGRDAVENYASPAQLNRLGWYSATGWRRPYPGDLRILAPNQVPGCDRPVGRRDAHVRLDQELATGRGEP